MSKGEGAYANLVLEDENTVIYEYGSYNLNDSKYRNKDKLLDGIISISRDCFVEPEIHKKLKKMPSGRKKLITKRIIIDVNYTQMIDDGRITIENCSNCWNISQKSNIDMMAFRLLSCLLEQYQKDGEIPQHFSFHV